MKISFKVIDTRTGKDITKERFWVIGCDGKLYYDNYDIIQAESFITYSISVEGAVSYDMLASENKLRKS